MLGFLTALIGSKGRYVFLRGGGVAGTSEGRVITESEHQKGRVIPLYNVFKGGYTPSPELFNEDFCDVAFHFWNSY